MTTESQKADDLEYLRAMSTTVTASPRDQRLVTINQSALVSALAELDAYKAVVSAILRVPKYSRTDPGTDDFKDGFNHRTQCDKNIANRHLNGLS